MKLAKLILALCLLGAGALPSVLGQAGPPPVPVADLPPLDQLLAPVALYPDPLIGLILPASTHPADIRAAAAYIAGGGNPNQIDAQPWDPSVKGLAHYPEVLAWMNDNQPWLQALGSAFTSGPGQVMGAVQDLRGRAKSAGTLANTPQQVVVNQGSTIAIEPAQDDEIYVPYYDPDLVYFAPPPGYYGGPFISFGPPFPMGIWLGFDFDWVHLSLWTGNWYAWRRAHGGWRHPIDFHAAGARAWHPSGPGPALAGRPGPSRSAAVEPQRRGQAAGPRPAAVPRPSRRQTPPPRSRAPAPRARPEEKRQQ